MTTRTVKMLGLAYGSTPAEIAVTLDGAPVYTGTVPTLDQSPLSGPDPDAVESTVEFCTFEIPMDFEGTKPMTCLVTNGTVIFAQITANYCVIGNAILAPGTGPDGFNSINGANDVRSNITIDGSLVTVDYEAYPGTWWCGVSSGSTLTYDLNVLAGTANVAPAP